MLDRLPNAVHDGFLPIKVRNEVVLRDTVFAIILPEMHRKLLQDSIPPDLAARTQWMDSAGLDVWEWSERVYAAVHAL